MKQSDKLSIILALTLLTVNGCLSTRQPANPSDTTIQTVILEGNPTTGFTWKYKIENPEIVSVEEERTYRGNPGCVGAPSDFTYTIHPLSEGKTAVLFFYERPWEEEPAEIRRFTAIVDEQGFLTLSENQ